MFWSLLGSEMVSMIKKRCILHDLSPKNSEMIKSDELSPEWPGMLENIENAGKGHFFTLRAQKSRK